MRFTALTYNLAPGRGKEAIREVHGLLDGYRPDVLALTETLGYEIPYHKGYTLIRDRSTLSRANISAYVRDTHILANLHWLDLEETWKRTEHPGQHEPRSYPVFSVDRIQVAVVHQPPRGTSNTVTAQREGIAALTKAMDSRWWRRGERTRPRLAIGDWNRRKGEAGPGPGTLAANIGGEVGSQGIDTAVARKMSLRSTDHITGLTGLGDLRSDHDGAMWFGYDVDPQWLS